MYESRHQYKLNKMLEFFKIAKSTYFYNINTYSKVDKDIEIKNEITSIFKENKSRYGYRRITLELRNRGIIINHKRVKRLMSKLGLYASIPTAKYKSYKGEIGKKAPNLLLVNEIDENGEIIDQTRDFTTTNVNQKWTTDVSEFHISEGKLYLSPILDMHNREIISYTISKSPNFNQIKLMLELAFEKYDDLEGLIFHSDQGWQYQMYYYQQELQSRGIRQSMSRKGNCLDNSPMENFFGIMKNEMFYGHEHDFNSLEELEQAMVEYIEYYNKNRITTKLKGLSPLMYRQQSFNQLQY